MNATIRFLATALLVLGPMATPAAPPITEKQVATAVAALEKLADRTLERTGTPGLAIAVVHRDRVVYARGFGVRQAGKPGRVDADTVFQIASVSKCVATTVLAALVGEGVIRWDDHLIDHLPGFQMYDPWVTRQITLRDMLCHRSGLHAQAGDLLEDIGYSRSEILHRFRHLKPSSSFRSHYAYTNFGFTAAAEAGARAAGKSWEDLATEKLYRPLGMTRTSSRFRDFAKEPNRAVLHVRHEGKWIPRYVRDPDAQSPAGGVSSSVHDLARWMRLQLAGGRFEGKQIVQALALAETHRPHMVTGTDPKTDQSFFYGLGWGVTRDGQGRLFWKHSGAFDLGVRSEVVLLPAEQLGIVTLSNAGLTGIPEGVNQSFIDLVYAGKLERDWVTVWNERFAEFAKTLVLTGDYTRPPAKPTPALPGKAYVGTYRNVYFGDLTILEEKKGLVLRIGPKKERFSLRHWQRDVFLYEPGGESATGPSAATFTIAADGRAGSVVLEILDGNKQGTFRRVAEGK